jgi:hypothetical protein
MAPDSRSHQALAAIAGDENGMTGWFQHEGITDCTALSSSTIMVLANASNSR